MQISNVLASIPVRDLAAAKAWYERVLGRAADSTPMTELAEWTFPGGGALQVYAGPERAGHGSCTLVVDDFDKAVAALKGVGVDVGDEIGGGPTRVVMIKDLDGNSLAFAHSDDPSMAR